MEALAVLGHRACHRRARCRRPVQAPLILQDGFPGDRRKGRDRMLRKLFYSLGALALMAMAVGAGFKPN
jgi:hypothetical protein